MFQAEMRILLEEMKRRGPPPSGDQDIASQLYRVMAENPDVSEDRVMSEIGILFVEGFETTGGRRGRRRPEIISTAATAAAARLDGVRGAAVCEGVAGRGC
jgi:hypothetical protein